MLEELDEHKKGVHRSRAQRAAGDAVPRRAGERRARRASPRAFRSSVKATKPRPARLYLQTETIATTLPPQSMRQGGQPDPRRRHAPVAQRIRSATSSWCPRTSTCGSRRARSAWPPRTTSTTRCSRTPTSSTAACASCRPISGTGTARAWSRGSRAATPTTGSAGRSRHCCI